MKMNVMHIQGRGPWSRMELNKGERVEPSLPPKLPQNAAASTSRGPPQLELLEERVLHAITEDKNVENGEVGDIMLT